MPDRERTEKVRQELMRLNELLGIMRGRLTDGERAYAELFTGLSPEQSATMNHKQQQWEVAERFEDLQPLKDIVSALRFGARELEKGFAELGGIIESTPDFFD